LFGGTSFLIEPSHVALEHDLRMYRFPPERAAVVPGAIDVDRFDPGKSLPDARAELGIPPDAFVVGIVARMQSHRHFEDLWEAAKQLKSEFPQLHVLVVGRGTNEEIVGRRPVQALGLERVVHFAGFRSGDDFLAALNAFDVKVFLMPGTDGTCRAVREAMAMGKPAIAARRGMLPEIVLDGETGIVFDDSPEALANAIRALITNRDRARAMGVAARKQAIEQFSLNAQVKAVHAIYDGVLSDSRVMK
jgi:glycosyltransferase involved in cell wall biosynthesis